MKSNGQSDVWADGNSYRIVRPTEATGSVRAVDVLDDPVSAVVDDANPAASHTITITNAGDGTFTLDINGQTLTVEDPDNPGQQIDATFDFDAPPESVVSATVDESSNTKQQVVTISRAIGGTFTLTLDSATTVDIAHDALATGQDGVEKALEQALKDAGNEIDVSVSRSQTGNDVTYVITFATDPGTKLVVDGANLEGNSVKELLIASGAFAEGEVSVSVDNDKSDNVRVYTITTTGEDFTIAVDGSQLIADGLLLNEDGTRNLDEINKSPTAAAYAAALQKAIDAILEPLKDEAEANAFEGTGFRDFTVVIGHNGTNLTFSVVGDPEVESGGDPDDPTDEDGSTVAHTLELRFATPIKVDAGGGRVALSTSPARFSTDAAATGTRIDRSLEIEITRGYDDAAYQQLGLLSAPTSFTGVSPDDIELKLIVNGDQELTIRLDNDNGGGPLPQTQDNTSIDELVTDLQTIVDKALEDAGLTGETETITVERTDENGNRIQFKGGDGITTIQVVVPSSYR